MTVRVKICGLTRAEDVAVAIDAGADALGFVFAASPRRVAPRDAEDLTATIPRGIIRVGLFMNAAADEVRRVLDTVALDLLQFHGDETPSYCAGFGLPFIKAVSMSSEDPEALARSFDSAAGILLDSHVPGGAGGTGKTFDWGRRLSLDIPLWLAGGLTPENVAEAVRAVKPWAVDVSSGVERSPGVKDAKRVRAFIQNAKKV